MKPLPERLNDRLEQREARSSYGEGAPDWLLSPVPSQDPEADELVALALRLQSAPPLQVDPDFAWQLEQRILTHNTVLRLEQPVRGWSFRRRMRAHPVFRVALSLCLLLLLLGTGVLVAAAQVTNPNNPLYAVKRWEQQVSLANSSEYQAEATLQFARDQLKTLINLAGTANTDTYRAALVELDQRISTAARVINAFPAGAAHERLASELAALKADARRTLRGLLSQLALSERLTTTGELGDLGDTVPRLVSVEVILPQHPNRQAIISISGDDIQPGAQLLVDSGLVEATGSLQNGRYVFVANWAGKQHSYSIGILNPDGTAAQTTTITLNGSDDHENSHHGGNGNGGGKP